MHAASYQVSEVAFIVVEELFCIIEDNEDLLFLS